MTRLIVAFRNFMKAPKNSEYFKRERRHFGGLMFFTCFIYIRPRYSEPSAYNCGPGSSVGIATGYGLDGPGIESR